MVCQTLLAQKVTSTFQARLLVTSLTMVHNCIKTVICDKGDDRFCTAYYEKCDAVNCCKCKDATFKAWDIHTGTFTKTNFVGYEDTTELNDNPVKGAEHWKENSSVPIVGKFSIGYDYFLHREANADIISHRIDYSAEFAGQSGSILYGDFQVQHDIDSFAQKFVKPQRCQGNILDCGCDDGANTKVDQKYFKHDYAVHVVRKAAARAVPFESLF